MSGWNETRESRPLNDNLAQIINYFVNQLGLKSLPETYDVRHADISGFDEELGCVVQIGSRSVEDRKEVAGSSVVLDRFADALDREEFKEHLLETKRAVEKDRNGMSTGRRYCMTPEKMNLKGIIPSLGMGDFCRDLENIARDKGAVVIHGAWQLFFPFVEKEPYVDGLAEMFDPNAIWDPGMFIKAAQTNLLPWPGDTLRDFCVRVGELRAAGVYWSLDRCYSCFQGSLPSEDFLDDAGNSAFAAYQIFETFRSIFEDARQEGRI